MTKAMIGRIRRLEEHGRPVQAPDYLRNPREVSRIILWRVGRPFNLTTSRCRRTITTDGYLSETVDFDGTGPLSEQEIDEFVSRFPIQQLEIASRHRR